MRRRMTYARDRQPEEDHGRAPGAKDDGRRTNAHVTSVSNGSVRGEITPTQTRPRHRARTKERARAGAAL
jgi:hypothetical protein